MDFIEYRAISQPEELEQMVDLEIAIWGSSARDAVPVSLLRALSAHGGLVTGAFVGQKMVGLGQAFPARHHGRLLLWSHNVGVHPDFQARGIGFGIKLAQRAWALEQGYREIGWTYNPLLRGNANFNLHRLGATSSTYAPNYYGIMRDTINAPLPSDRLEAIWKLTDPRVKRLSSGGKVAPLVREFEPDALILRADASNQPQPAAQTRLPQPHALIQIPRDTLSLPADAQESWLLALRAAMQTVFAAGYVAVDFVELDGVAAYVLRAPTHWFLYVLRCADNSLYTGISPDVEARIKTHNAGKGAAYTSTRRPVTLLGGWEFDTKGEALKAELAFKQLTRAQKFGCLNKRDAYRGGPWMGESSKNLSIPL